MFLNPFTNKQITASRIHSDLLRIFQLKPNNLHIDIFIDDQILFQVMAAKNFSSHGFQHQDPDDYTEIHFFNKNKTKTIDAQYNIKNTDLAKAYYYYEEPKGNHNFLRAIGKDPDKIAHTIMDRFKVIYGLKELSSIRIDYNDY